MAAGDQLLDVRHRDWVTDVAFAPRGTRLATASGPAAVRAIDFGGRPPGRLGPARIWPSLKSVAVGIGLVALGLTIAWVAVGSGISAGDRLWGIGGAVSIGVGLLLIHPVEEYA